MVKKIVASALMSAVVIGLSGCGASAPVPVYTPVQKQITLKSMQKASVSNGALVLNNGEKIFDEDGEIIRTYTLNKKVFYILRKENKTFELKDINKNVIKDFKANKISIYDSNNEIYFAVQKTYNRLNIFDFVYKFNGKDLKIINKNIRAGGFPSGIYSVHVY